MIITFLSDTHSKHLEINKKDLPGGDLLIHAGDITSRGYEYEIEVFCDWFNTQKYYDNKLFIAGNHDFYFQDNPNKVKNILDRFENINYLQDNGLKIDNINIWGTPWQPKFFDWAFNLERNSEELKAKWDLIPNNTDILITHAPPFGHLDIQRKGEHMGCELLEKRLNIIKPKIHIFGHNHYGYGYKVFDNILYINATVLNDRYVYTKKPITIDWNPETNEFTFI